MPELGTVWCETGPAAPGASLATGAPISRMPTNLKPLNSSGEDRPTSHMSGSGLLGLVRRGGSHEQTPHSARLRLDNPR
jgi:hypothetical protein